VLHLRLVLLLRVTEDPPLEGVLGDLVEPGGVLDDLLRDEGVGLAEEVEVDLDAAGVERGLPGEEISEETLVLVEFQLHLGAII
jgi:hypothetical protein